MEESKPDNQQNSTGIEKLFDAVAYRYDLANHLLSLWMDSRWRRKSISLTSPAEGQTLLDMCCGTGDIVFISVKTQPGLKTIIGCDFSNEMLNIAEKKQARIDKSGAITSKISWLNRDCLDTGLDDESFDIITCAFGVRNMSELGKGLAEMYRLVKSGGRVCILEFSLPENVIIRWWYLFYFRFILPILAGIITGRFKAYRYLVESVIKWEKQINLENELLKAGFVEVSNYKHTFGLATTYLGHKYTPSGQ